MTAPRLLMLASALAGSVCGVAVDVFSAAPVTLPALPGGQLALRETFGGPEALGGAVWPAAEMLCRWLQRERQELQGARILELGSGTGACGLFAAANGASHVTLTDGGSDALMKLMQLNIEGNRALLGGSRVDVQRLLWGDVADGCVVAAEAPYTHVLAADVLYGLGSEPEAAAADATARCEALATTIEALMLCAPAPPRVIIAYTYRPAEVRSAATPWDHGDDVLNRFFSSVAKRGLRARELASEPPRLLHTNEAEQVRTWSADMCVFEVGQAL